MAQNQVAAPGKVILRVVGIVTIVFAVITIILSAVTMFGGAIVNTGLSMGGETAADMTSALTEAGIDQTAAAGAGILAVVLGVIMLLSGIFNLVVGILSTAFAARPEKAKVLLVLGIICLVFAACSFFGGFTWESLLGFILPGLLVTGAVLNKKAIQA